MFTFQKLPQHGLDTGYYVQLTVLQSFCKGQCCAAFGSWQRNTRCELCTLASIIKNASLIFTLLSVASNLMVNKNTASLLAKLFIQPQFKISQLQFLQCVSAQLQLQLLIYLFMYLFSLCILVFSFSYYWRGRVFSSIFHLSHLVEFGVLISSLWYGVRHFRNNCQVQIKNGWSGCKIELLNTSREWSDGYGTWFFLLSSSSFAFVSSGGFSL